MSSNFNPSQNSFSRPFQKEDNISLSRDNEEAIDQSQDEGVSLDTGSQQQTQQTKPSQSISEDNLEEGRQWVRRASQQDDVFKYAFTSGQLDHPED
ncbi:hypothetical protein AWENTII_010573 [Aspergillus wentii]|nr:hypothetical protein MW887_009743 [Aspergillus wentii]